MKKENHNGWSYWYVKRSNGMISIDQLRHDYEKKYLQNANEKTYKEIQFETNLVNEPEGDF